MYKRCVLCIATKKCQHSLLRLFCINTLALMVCLSTWLHRNREVKSLLLPVVQCYVSLYQWRGALKIFTLGEMQYVRYLLRLWRAKQSTSLFFKCCLICALPCETWPINDFLVAVVPWRGVFFHQDYFFLLIIFSAQWQVSVICSCMYWFDCLFEKNAPCVLTSEMSRNEKGNRNIHVVAVLYRLKVNDVMCYFTN